jgi:putative membrane-bound dehydrogenase-like protein
MPTPFRFAPIVAAVCSALFTPPAVAQAVDDPQWKLPPGFTIERVAGPQLVQHPTMGCFDDQGRLYLCDGPGDNLPAKDLLADPPHSIKRLEDTDGDGRFDRVVTFADKLVFPQGALWHDGAIYTASPPNIWKLTDTDGDGICDERKILVSEFGFTGNAADIHGCFLGPDGRIYWCDGRHGHTFIDEQGRTISKGLAARLFSCRPDGSDVQVFAGGGMDNPVEVDFTEEGEPLGTVAIYDNNPDRIDALIHWVYGGAYPYAQQVLGEFKKTGPLLPAVRYFGRVAPAGILRYRSPAWGKEFTDNLFHVQFNTHRLIRTKLTRDGATFRGEDEEFLISEHTDVHLTDVIEDADGSLLVVDTGGWFRQGCPNSQIAKPEILGGVYRIRKTDAAKVDDPRGLAINWKSADAGELTSLLDDGRPTVRDRAADLLVKRMQKDETAVLAAFEVTTKATADFRPLSKIVWTLARSASPPARAGLQEATASADPRLRQIAARALGTLRDATAAKRLTELLTDPDFAVRREAATALGMLGGENAVPTLLTAISHAAGDRFLEHALIYALIQINDGSQTIAGLEHEHAAVRRGALIALDQNNDSSLTRERVAALLDADNASLQRTVLGVMQRHPDWADGVLDFLKKRLAAPSLASAESDLLRDTILAYKADARVQQIVADALAAAATAPAQRKFLLEVIERSEFSGKTIPPEWAEQLTKHLGYVDDAIVRQAVTASGRIGGEEFDGALLALAGETKRPDDLRVAALSVIGNRIPSLEPPLFLFLTSRLTTAADPLDRTAAAKVLGIAPLDGPQRNMLLDLLAKAGPLELPPLLEAFARPGALVDGAKLIAALAASPGLDNVTSSSLEKLLQPYSEEVRTAAQPLFKRINADIDAQRARLGELAAQLDGGDPKRGAIVFQMAKTACSSCHRVGARGTAVGPDLTKVGQIRSRGDLLEAVVYPSASFVRNYESVAVETSDGRVVIGLLTRETPEAIYVRTPQKEEIRVPRSDVESISPSKLSIMPQGLDKILNLEELRDLIAYLQTLK